MQNLEKNILIAANMAWGIWWILTKTPKIWNFMGSLRPKCTKNQSKNDRRITCHHTEQWSKIWIFTWELESLKVCTLMELLYPPLITYWLKTIEELCVITLNRHTKFEEEPTYCCKKDMRSLVNFNLSTQKSQIWNFMGSLRPRCTKKHLKNYRRVMSHHTEQWCKIWGKAYLSQQKWYEEFGKFSWNH